jgi:hypothetical protein
LILSERSTLMFRKEWEKVMYVDIQRASLRKVLRLQVSEPDSGPPRDSLIRLALHRQNHGGD